MRVTNSQHRRALLRRIMRRNGLLAPEVAALAGVKHQTVRAYMCGVRPVPVALITLLIDRYGAPAPRARRQQPLTLAA